MKFKIDKNEKKRIFASLSIVCAVCILIAVVVFYQKETYHTVNASVSVTEEGYHPANNRQYASSVRLFVWDDKLFFYHYGASKSKAQYYQELCAFEDGSIVSYGKIATPEAISDGYVYYNAEKPQGKYGLYVYFGNSKPLDLKCMNLSTKESKYVRSVESYSLSKVHYDPDGTCYIPDKKNKGNYYILKDGNMSESVPHAEMYSLGSNQYAIEDHDLVRYDTQGEREVLKEFIGLGSTCIIPCDNGLLVYVEGGSNLLYYIPEETEIVEPLFNFPGFASDSAVNVHGEWVYVSFARYESLDGCGLTKFEDDTMEGTYRINLTDGTSEKLSDAIYTGLFIFDNTGIYACKQGCIYKLDFDGNVIMTLLA